MTEEARAQPQPADAGDAEAEEAPEPAGPSHYERAQRRLRVDGVAFGQAVTRLREAERWSVRTLSRKSGVPLTTLAKLERGETPQPDAEVTTALAFTFGYGSAGAMLGAGSTAGPGGRRRDREEPLAALTLEKLVESLLRGIWAASSARPGGALVTEPLPEPSGSEGDARVASAQELLQRLPSPAGMNLYVPLVVLVEPRTVG